MSAGRVPGGRRAGFGIVLLAALGLSRTTAAAELQLVGAAEPMLPGIVSRATDEQAVTVHPDGTLVIFACPDCEPARDPDLWITRRRHGTWEQPGRAKPSSRARESSPAFSADGNFLYYASERSGGVGGSDLYRTNYSPVREAFDPVENLGPAVNSPGDEGGAAARMDGGVVFASRGRKGARGWDLFLSTRVNGRLVAAKPLASLNTAADETAPALLPGDAGLLFVRDGQAWFAARRGEGYAAPQRLDAAINAPGRRVLGVQHAHDTPDQLVFTRAGSDGRGDVLRIRYRIVAGEEGDRAADDR